MPLTGPSPEPFVILAMPRTGTHYLEELLNEHPHVSSNGELLNSYDANWPDTDRLLLGNRELLERAYLCYPEGSDKLAVTHVGCKINEPQLHDRPGFFTELTRWPGLKVILVTRTNTLESLRSLVQARQTRQWLKFDSGDDAPGPRVKLSTGDCEAYFEAADEFHARVMRSFAPVSRLVIVYEDLLRTPTVSLQAIWNFLGVPAIRLSGRTALQRQEARPLDQTVENFHELQRHFAGGRYAKFFEQGDCQVAGSVTKR